MLHDIRVRQHCKKTCIELLVTFRHCHDKLIVANVIKHKYTTLIKVGHKVYIRIQIVCSVTIVQ